MESEPAEQVLFHGHPSWLSMTPFLIRWLTASLVLGIAAGIASTLAAGHVQTAWVILAVVAVWLLMFCRGQLRRLRVTYRITSRRLAIETGLIFRRLHETRLEQVQDVNARQTLLERALGVGTVHFRAGGESDWELRFRGVEDPRGVVRTVDRALSASQPESRPPVCTSGDN